VNNDLVTVWKVVLLAKFEVVLFRNLPGGTKE